MPQPTFSSSLPHKQEEVSSPTSRNRRILLLSPPRTRRSLPSPLLFIQRKTLYSTKVFSFQSPIKYVEQAGTCCIVQVLQRSVNMLALLSKVCCVPTAVLLGSLRSNRVLTGAAAPQPTLPGPAGARPVLQGLLAASRAVCDVSCVAASCSCLGCHPACWEQQPTSNAFPCIQDLLLSVQARAGQLAYFPGTRSPPPVRRVRKIESYSLTRHRGYIRPTFDLISGNLPIHSPQSSRSMRFV